MNGEALTKRYEVRDAETGEVVEGPVHVLRPKQDEWARTAMYVYLHLCGVEDYGLKEVLVRPNETALKYLPKMLEERGLPKRGGASYNRRDLIYRPDKNRSEVTLAEVDELAAGMGLEVSSVVYQETEEAARKRRERQARDREKAVS